MSGGGSGSGQREVPDRDDGFDLPSVLARLDADDPDRQREAVRTIRTVVDDRPSACTPTVPKLRALLDRPELDFHDQVVVCLAELAVESPTDVAPSTAEIVSFVEAGPSTRATTAAFRCLSAVAEQRPTAVLEHVDSLVDVLRGDPDEYDRWGVDLLSRLARTHPQALTPAVPVLETALESDVAEVRATAVKTIARVSADDGDGDGDGDGDEAVIEPARTLLRDRLEDDESVVRRNACLALGYSGVVEARERLETLATADPNATVRNCASWAVLVLEDSESDSGSGVEFEFESEFTAESGSEFEFEFGSESESESQPRSEPESPPGFRSDSTTPSAPSVEPESRPEPEPDPEPELE